MVNRKQIDRLWQELCVLPKHPVGRCLTEEDEIAYVQNSLSSEEFDRVDAHIASCSDCARDVAVLLESYEDGREDEPEIDVVKQTVWQKLRAVCAEFSYPVASCPSGNATTAPSDIGSDDFGIFVEEQGFDITVRVDSTALDLEGATLRFTAGKKCWDMPLSKVPGNRFGAELVIHQQDRTSLPVGTRLRVNLLDKPGKPMR